MICYHKANKYYIRLRGGVKVPTGGYLKIFSVARELSDYLIVEFGESPMPTVKVRMKEDGNYCMVCPDTPYGVSGLAF